MPEPNLDLTFNSLRGVALGDSLGLVYEGLSPLRGTRIYPFPLRQRLFFGKGMTSDDTAQSALIAESLMRHPNDVNAFQADFGKELRKWFLSLPPGIGLSTAKACLRLCFGTKPKFSGVASAGNGAAMRSAVIGAAFAHDEAARVAFVEASARVTHTHRRAIEGAQLIALAAALAANGSAHDFDQEARRLAGDWPWDEGWPERRGPSGYVIHSVNAAIAIWKEGLSWEASLARVVQLGGDTDTVGAMVGGILGASGDFTGVSPKWERSIGWPQRSDYEAIARGSRVSFVRLALSHAMGLPIVLLHGFRRLLPPY